MPKPAGWALRDPVPDTVYATGTTSLTLTKPVGTVDNDILIMTIGHKGTDWAVVPAGWTLIEREVSSGTRGELYWKRAASEPANYSITGLATAATGFIVGYTGGLLTGNVVAASGKSARPGGATAATGRFGGPSLDTTGVPNALLLAVFVVSSTAGASFMAYVDETNPTPIVGNPVNWIDRDLLNIVARGTTSDAGGVRAALFDQIKPIEGHTGIQYDSSTPFAVPYVGLTAVLIPETGAGTSGSRFYLSGRFPVTRVAGPVAGTWQSGSFDGPRTYAYNRGINLLSQNKSIAGHTVWNTYTRGGGLINIAGESVLYGRWMTSPLTAQEISGTLDLANYVGARWVQGTTAGPTPDVRFKVHAYITVGQTTAVRHVLLDEYVDSVAWPDTNAVGMEWRGLASPQVLDTGSALAGDSVIVELGAHVIASTTPLSTTLPASNYVQFRTARGGQYRPNSSSGTMPPGAPDAIVGPDIEGPFWAFQMAPWIAFSHTFVEQTLSSTIPTHTTRETAEVITLVGDTPFTDTLDTSQVPVPTRAVFYKFTADRAGKFFIHVIGSGFHASITSRVTKGVDSDAQASEWNELTWFSTGICVVMDVEIGDLLEFNVSSATTELYTGEAACSGGELHVFARWQLPPADNDLIVVSSGIFARYRGTELVDILPTAYTWTGLAIDYSGLPIYDNEADDDTIPHTGHRMLAAYYLGVSSPLINIGDIDRWDPFGAETSWMGEVWDDTSSVTPSAIATKNDGTVVVSFFGNGFQRIANVNASYQNEVTTLNRANINVSNITENDFKDAPDYLIPIVPATEWVPTLEAGGTNYCELAQDGVTLFYTSGGWYTPVGGQNVYTMNIETGAVALFATVPVGPGPNPGLKGLFPLPDGTVLVCNGGEIVRLDAGGDVIQTYTPVTSPELAQSFADVEPTSDGLSFWAWEEANSVFWQFDIATGAELAFNPTFLGSGSSTSIVVYRMSGFVDTGESAGEDQAMCLSEGMVVTLAGVVSGTYVSATWSQVSGPAATITDPTDLNTTVTGILVSGAYVFRLTVVR